MMGTKYVIPSPDSIVIPGHHKFLILIKLFFYFCFVLLLVFQLRNQGHKTLSSYVDICDHSEPIFVFGVRKGSRFLLFHVDSHMFQKRLLKRHWYFIYLEHGLDYREW